MLSRLGKDWSAVGGHNLVLHECVGLLMSSGWKTLPSVRYPWNERKPTSKHTCILLEDSVRCPKRVEVPSEVFRFSAASAVYDLLPALQNTAFSKSPAPVLLGSWRVMHRLNHGAIMTGTVEENEEKWFLSGHSQISLQVQKTAWWQMAFAVALVIRFFLRGLKVYVFPPRWLAPEFPWLRIRITSS